MRYQIAVALTFMSFSINAFGQSMTTINFNDSALFAQSPINNMNVGGNILLSADIGVCDSNSLFHFLGTASSCLGYEGQYAADSFTLMNKFATSPSIATVSFSATLVPGPSRFSTALRVNLKSGVPGTQPSCAITGAIKALNLEVSKGDLKIGAQEYSVYIDNENSGPTPIFTVTCNPAIAEVFVNYQIIAGFAPMLRSISFSSTSSPQIDLSLSSLLLTQSNKELQKDSSGNSIVATTTPSSAKPAPAVPPAPVTAFVTIGSNIGVNYSGPTITDLQIKLGNAVLASQAVDIRQASASVTFIPPNDEPNLLGVLPLTATINSSGAIQELNTSNNSTQVNVNTMVLCKVSDSGRNVSFQSQVDERWGEDPLGFKAPGTMKKFGCAVSSLAMLFQSFGISNTPHGSPFNPVMFPPLPKGLNGETLTAGSLNFAMTNYRSNLLVSGSVGYTASSDVDWIGAVNIARAGYQAQCESLSNLCDPRNAPNVISFKKLVAPAGGYTGQDAITSIQNEICGGNPVVLGLNKTNGKQHFVLATGIAFEPTKKEKSIQLNNPGTITGQDQFYNLLNETYPSIKEYVSYHPAADPSMMFIAAPMNVDFLVTDPLGRRTGFDPNSQSIYNEIPGASYSDQSISAPGESEFSSETLVEERYFTSSADVVDGNYRIQVFSHKNGSYYIDSRSYDSVGTLNDSNYRTGNLSTGQSETLTLVHNSSSVPVPNATLKLQKYSIKKLADSDPSANIEISGTITPFSASKVVLDSSFQIGIGGVTGYHLSIPGSKFKIKKFEDHKTNRTSYSYQLNKTEVTLSDSGDLKVKIDGAILSTIDSSQFGYLQVDVDSLSASVRSTLRCKNNICSLGD